MSTYKKIAYIFCAIFVVGLLFSITSVKTTRAETEQERLENLKKQIQEYEQEVTKLKNQANTLSNQIAQYDAQIRLTTLKISETVEKIDQLGFRIDALETSIESLTEAFASRAVKTYKMSRLQEPYLLLVSASDLSDAVSSYHYLQKIQEADRDLLTRLASAQDRYEVEKGEQEDLQAELESQKAALDSQKAAKDNLLAATKNDEKKYQQLLAAARTEYESIQAVLAGRGDETEAGHVDQGQRIANIIQGASCNSSGGHLHFIVSSGGNTQNPFNYLKPGIGYENCSGAGACSEGDAFNPSGSWEWPIQPTVHYSQGYGSTWAVNNTWVGGIYKFHNGIDIDSSSSSEVRAVQPGTLYQGSYTGYNGCRLRYVRVDHDNSDLETFYLHINY